MAAVAYPAQLPRFRGSSPPGRPEWRSRPADRAGPGLLYWRRRLVAALLAVAVSLIGVMAVVPLARAVGAVLAPDGPTGGRAPAHVYVVQPGDTFWSIARSLDPDGDPRPVVDRLVATHGSTLLHPGQELVLPAPPTSP